MPNYKQCRFCSNKYVPLRDERICPDCEKDVIRAVSMPTGEPVMVEAGGMKVSFPPDSGITEVTIIAKDDVPQAEYPVSPNTATQLEDSEIKIKEVETVSPDELRKANEVVAVVSDEIPIPEKQEIKEVLEELAKEEDTEIIEEKPEKIIVEPTGEKSE